MSKNIVYILNLVKNVDVKHSQILWVLFYLRGNTMSKLEIYCPKCGRLIINANDFAGSYLEKKCRKCKKLVIYTPEDGRVVSKDIPPRNTSSGMRFY